MVSLLAWLTVALVVVLFTLVVYGVHVAGQRAKLAAPARLTLATGAGLAAWLAMTTALAESGVLAAWSRKPPPLIFVPLAAAALLAAATRAASFRRALLAAPLWWLVALQSMRVPIELGLDALHHAGTVPVHLTFEGRNFDVLVGLTAPLMAWLVARGHVGARGLVLWHAASLALLVNIVGMAITSTPGPLRVAWPGEPLTIVVTAPFVWLPAFLVPVALFGHVLSLRQLAAARARQGMVSAPLGA